MPKRTVLVKLAWLIGGLMLLLVIASGTAFWLAGRPTTLDKLLQFAVAKSGGRLTIEEAQGSLYGPVRIKRIRFEDEKQKITAEDITFDWSPELLVQRVLTLSEVSIGRIEVVIKQSSQEPPKLPDSLRLPVEIRAPKIIIGELSIASAPSLTVIHAIRLGFTGNDKAHSLQIDSADLPWGTAQGHAKLEANKPFPLNAEVRMTSNKPRQFVLAAKADGPLDALSLSANVRSGTAILDAAAEVDSFAAAPLKHIKLIAQHIDLKQLQEGLPSTGLDAAVEGSMDKDGKFSGMLTATNALAGTLDNGKVPFKAITAAIHGDPKQWQASALRLDLGDAGLLSGSASGKGTEIRLVLDTNNLNLAGIHRKLRTTKLAGNLALEIPNSETQHIAAKLAQQAMRIRLDATRTRDSLRLAQLQLASASGQLDLTGELRLTANKPFQVNGKLSNFNLAEFGSLPLTRITATIASHGQLTPTPQGNLQFVLGSSQWRGQPLSGQGKLQFSTERIADADVTIAIAQNRFSAKGALGRRDDRLAWRIDAPQLRNLEPTLAGSLQGRGEVRGSFADPAIAFDITGQKLVLPGGYSLTSLTGNGNIETGREGAMNVELRTQGISYSRYKLASAQLTINGVRARHTLKFSATQPSSVDFTLEATGGWNARTGWEGMLQRLDNKGDYAASLRSPARIAIGPEHAQIGNFILLSTDGTLAVEELQWSKGNLAAKGALHELSLARLQKIFPQELRADDVTTTLKLGGEWDIRVGDEIDGRLRIGREQGDIVLLATPNIPLKLSVLELRAEARKNRITANLAVAGATIGTVNATLNTQLERRNDVWGVPSSAPLVYTANADTPSLAWLTLLVGDGVAFDGRAQMSLARQGSAANGQFSGKIDADRLVFRVADYGVALKDGVLHATFDGNKLALEQFSIHADHGMLTATGALNLDKNAPVGGVQIRADKLALLNHPDYRLTVSGEGQVSLENSRLAVRGQVHADEGQISLPKNDAPHLGNDVVVLGKTNERKKQSATPLTLDVQIDLGDHFKLRGRGLDAQLAGQLRIRSAPQGLPYGSGSIRVVEGTYEGYGQRLSVDRGILTFAGGPLNNPGLDFIALRKNLAVEAGIAITGTALAPRVRLTSTPPVPDSEKLAWLTLGHGLEGASRSDMDVLSAAATALASQGDGPSLPGRIARAVGLDELAVTGSGAESRALAVGKRISSSLYLSYEMAISGASRIAKLQYELSRRWSVRAEAGTSSAVDLLYTLQFD